MPLLIVGAVSYNSAADALIVQTRQQLDNVAGKTVEQVSHFFDVVQKDLRLLSNSPFVQLAFLQYEFNQRLNTARRLLDDYCNKNKYYNNVYLIDLNAECILSISDGGSQASYSDWVTKTLDRGRFVSDFNFSNNNTTSGIIMCEIVYDFEIPDRKIGILAFDIKKEAFINYVADLRIGKRGRAFLIHNTGHLIYHPDHTPGALLEIDLVMKGDQRFKDHILKMMAGQKGYGDYSYENAEKFIVYQPCKQMNWSIGLTVFKSELMADIHKLRKQVLTFTAIVFGLFLPVTFFFVHGLTRPIRKLMAGAKDIRKGNLGQKIQIDSKDEFSALAREFNKMAQTLKGSLNEILNLKNFKEDIFRNLSSGIITVDDGGRITSINKSAQVMLGCTADDKQQEALPVQQIRDLLKAAMVSGKDVLDHELELPTANGEMAYVEVNTSQLKNISGGMIGAIADIRDITRRKRMEEIMVRVDKLASLGQLSAGMAHEIRNPLAGIKTSVQVLAERAGSEDEKVLISGILSEINRLNKIVSDLLSFSRPSKPRLNAIEAPRILEKVIEMVKEKIRKHHIQVTYQWEEGLPKILADKEQLHQIFLNLTLNGIKSMEKGGTLSLSAHIFRDKKGLEGATPRNLDIKAYEKPYIAIRFKDTGHGIAKENLSRVFNPFFSTSPSGTGLGLPIVHTLMEKNSGYIFIDSIVSKGTQVLLLLPIATSKGHGNFNIDP